MVPQVVQTLVHVGDLIGKVPQNEGVMFANWGFQKKRLTAANFKGLGALVTNLQSKLTVKDVRSSTVF